MFCIVSERMARSSAYTDVVHEDGDVLKWYPMLSFSSHLKSGSRKIINK